MADAPSISGLFRASRTHWGKWGPDDEIGALNFLDAAQVLRGAACVRSGKVFPLGLSIGRPGGDPIVPIRAQPQKFMSADKGAFENAQVSAMPGGQEWSDDAIFMYLQGTTHVDALGHVWFDDTLYNGFDAHTTNGGLTRCGVEKLADHGIVGRGVLLDVARHRGVDWLEANEMIPLRELREVASAQNVSLERRDILLIRTGRLRVFYEGAEPAQYFEGDPGITDEPELIEFFADMEIPALASDTIGSEQSVSSVSGATLPLHAALLRNLGVLFQEMLDLERLAQDCAADGQYSFLYVASPLRVVGGTGSPLNPLAIK